MKRSMVLIMVLVALLLPLSRVSVVSDQTHSFDVVVYGATPSGVAAGIEAKREGLTVAVVEPSGHIGGMVTAGLTNTDIGPAPSVIGGIAREYFDRIGATYHRSTGWQFEPHVGAAVLSKMISEAGVPVFVDEPLVEGAGAVLKDGRTLESITTKTGASYSARVFIDATYEGDLMAAAGVSYTYGRESSAQYGEPDAGVQPWPTDTFTPPISAFDSSGGLFPGISPVPPGPVGSADRNVQAYTFRFTTTNVAANRVPFPMPAGYDPARYALLAEWLPVLQASLGRDLKASDVLSLYPLPDGKFDTNSKGSYSTDFVNGNVGYPDGSDSVRAQIVQQTKDYVQGLLYFLSNDPSVPASLRADMANYGLAKDEFTDTNNFPTQMYVREARRMIGAYVLGEQDERTNTVKSDAIAMGAYRQDAHAVERVVTTDGNAQNEGELSVYANRYQIPYRAITPQQSQATNLLVTCALSSSHVAFASLRMEPQLMMLGQAAGSAARLAITDESTVQGISVPALQAQLQRNGAILSLHAPTTVIVDNSDQSQITTTGTWTASTASPGYFGANYLHSDASPGPSTVTFRPNLPRNGTYAVYARWTANPNRTTTAHYAVTDDTGKPTTVTENQQTNGGQWVLLGNFAFNAGDTGRVTLTNAGTTGYVIADAVEFIQPNPGP